MLAHLAHEQRAGHDPAERRRVEVAAARGLDVEGAALERDQAVQRESLAAVDEHRILGAVLARAAGDCGDVGLVVLAEVGGEGVGDGALLAHPGERAAGVEAAREGDADALADRQRAEDLAAAAVLSHCRPRGSG